MMNFIQTYVTFERVMEIIYLVNFLIALALIFFDKKSPPATMAWIMVLFMIPVLGLILYLLFSQNIARIKVNRMSNDETEGMHNLVEQQKRLVRNLDNLVKKGIAHKWSRLALLNLDYSSSLITMNSSADVIYDGNEFYEQLKKDISNAKHTIKLCFFIIRDDEIGMDLINLLSEKARQGVKVRLLMDAMGSRSMGCIDLREFKKSGGKYAFYFKPIVRYLFLRFNYRNHRKLCIIDNEIGYIGGFNIAKEYLGKHKKFGYWRDTMLRVKGDALITLNGRFYLDWRYASGEDIDIINSSTAYTEPDSDDHIPIQIVSSGPDSPREEIKLGMLRMISEARHSIYLQTPYLVPDQAMMEALSMAARSGVDVHIMIPCMPDHMFVYRTTLHNAGRLIKDGAQVHIYDNGFIHAKTLVVDDEVCTVGSSNFDIRSFRLNFETNAFIFDSNIALDMRRQFEKDLESSHQYTEEDRANISLFEHLAESVSRLLAEIL